MAQPSLTPLSQSEANEILRAGPKGILVGGSALAFWATYLGLVPASGHEAGITTDIDFMGSASQADEFADRLDKALPENEVKTRTATLDDHTPNSAKILIYRFHGRDEAVEIDYLRQLHGFNLAEEKTLRRRAMRVVIEETTKILVMHPLDLLRSKVLNLSSLPGKQGKSSIAQCRIAVKVAYEFLKEICRQGVAVQRQSGLRAVEEIAALARSNHGIRLATKHRIRILEAIPHEDFEAPQFQGRRWPQISRYTESKIRRSQEASRNRTSRGVRPAKRAS